MYQKQKTKKHYKQEKRFKFLILFFILIFVLLSGILLYRIATFKKILFISPISSTGFHKNSDFEEKLKKAGVHYSDLKVVGDSFQFNVLGQGHVTMAAQKNVDSQISSLQLILKRIKIEGKTFKSLDFRFDTPVITF
jgi:hypothetical protein